MRGEFIRADGLVIPNNITTVGAQQVLRACFRNESPSFWVGVCQGIFSPGLQVGDLIEPSFVSGYARVQLGRDTTDWPTISTLNGEAYVESTDITWSASGTWSNVFNRLFICGSQAGLTGDVFCLGSILPDDIQFNSGDSQTFKYRIYL